MGLALHGPCRLVETFKLLLSRMGEEQISREDSNNQISGSRQRVRLDAKRKPSMGKEQSKVREIGLENRILSNSQSQGRKRERA